MKLFRVHPTFLPAHLWCLFSICTAFLPGPGSGAAQAAPATSPNRARASQALVQDLLIPPRFDDQGNYRGAYRATEPRVLNFPPKSYGGLAITLQNKTTGQSTSKLCKAQGRVVVPRDAIVTFYPEFFFFQNPHDLDSMAPDSFDNVIVRYVSMEDKDEGKLDDAIAALNHFTGIRFLDVSRTEASDRGLSRLNNLTNLEYLDCFLCETKGAFLQQLVNCKKLKWLTLAQNKLASQYLRYLPEYTGLKFLELTRTNLSGSDGLPLGNCRSLQYLDIRYNTKLSPDVDKVLMKLANLKELKVSPGQLSQERLARFIAAGRADLVKVVNLDTARQAKQKQQNAASQDEATSEGFANSVFKPLSKGRGF